MKIIAKVIGSLPIVKKMIRLAVVEEKFYWLLRIRAYEEIYDSGLLAEAEVYQLRQELKY